MTGPPRPGNPRCMTEMTTPAGPLRRLGILTLILAVLFQVTLSVAEAMERAPA